MTAPRCDGAPRAGDDLDALIDIGLDIAQRMVNHRGGIDPFAVAMTIAGEVEVIGAPGTTDAGLDAPTRTEGCLVQLAARGTDLRAVAMVYRSWSPASNRGVLELAVEHVGGAAVAVRLPYTWRKRGGRVEYGRLDVTAGVAQIGPAG
jgi:hypothetical protein